MQQLSENPAGLTDRPRFVLSGVVLCFILSGFAALLYQTAWLRQFSLVFGTSELAVAAVLSAYMGGLALGAGIAARYVHRVRRPVLFYGILEAGIAISALSVPWLLELLHTAYVAAFGGQPQPVDASGPGQSFFYLVSAFVVLAIPTSFMGATLPLLTKYVVRSSAQIGPRVGLLYATNTVGAVAGTIAAGFVLLPRLGLTGTVQVGVAVNVVVFTIAALIARCIDHTNGATPQHNNGEAASDVADQTARGRLWILPIMLLSGANSFIYEVLWTRLLGHILGGSITAFATMLASFLGGIAIGSAVASRFATSRARAINIFVAVQFGIAAASAFIYRLLPLAIPETTGLQGNVVLAAAILLPATLFIGATFPLAVRILATSGDEAASSAARVYSWNTVGAIAGATFAAFLLIPALRYEGAIQVAVGVNVMLAIFTATMIGQLRKPLAITTAALALVVIAFFRPDIPEAILRTSPVIDSRTGEIRFYEVGRSATVLVLEDAGYLNIRTNGLPEASTNLKGAPPYKHNQRLLSALPVLVRPDIDSMLIVGFGAGATLEGVPPSVSSIDVVELEPAVIAANRSISAEREVDPLADPRVNVYINDARSALALTVKRYDAIVSQPSHPWTAGASHLYTREYMQLAKDHLTNDGVYLQWMSSQFVDEALLKSLCATMLDVFDNVRVYQWDPEVLFFLGSDAALDAEQNLARTGRPLSDDRIHYLEKGVGSVEDLVVALAMDQENVAAFAEGAPLITDNFNYMATRSAQVMNSDSALTLDKLIGTIAPYDPLLQEDSWLHHGFPGSLNFTYISRRLEGMYLKQRAVALANVLVEEGNPEALIMIGLGQERQGERQESQKNLMLAIRANPDDHQARYALLRPWLARVSREEEIPQYVADEIRAIRGTGAITIRAWLAASQNKWQELAQLDSALAEAKTTDLWYLDAVKLRADWRIKVTTPEYQPRLAREATRLIDNAIALFQDPDFYAMRLASAYVADDVLDIIETARRLIYVFGTEVTRVEDGQIQPDLASIRAKLRQVNVVRQILTDIGGDERIPVYKLAQLEVATNQVARRLQMLVEDRQ